MTGRGVGRLALHLLTAIISLSAGVGSGRALFDSEFELGVFLAGIALFAGWAIWRSWADRRGRAATRTDALVAAAMFLFCGGLGLAAAITGGRLGVVRGGLASLILLPAAALILWGVWRSRGEASTG